MGHAHFVEANNAGVLDRLQDVDLTDELRLLLLAEALLGDHLDGDGAPVGALHTAVDRAELPAPQLLGHVHLHE